MKNFPPPFFFRGGEKKTPRFSFVAGLNPTTISILSLIFLPLLTSEHSTRRFAGTMPDSVPRVCRRRGSLSELRVPFMHQKTSSDQQTASYPFLGARTPGLNGVTGKAGETRERNQDTYNIEVMRRDSTLAASQ